MNLLKRNKVIPGLTRQKAREIGAFSVLYVLERILTGLMPLIILYLTDPHSYSRLEYIFSISTLLLPFADVFIRMYLYFGYASSENKTKFTETAFSILTVQLVLLAVMTLVFMMVGNANLLYSVIRVGYLSLFFFLLDFQRLNNKQSQILRESIIVNLTIVGLVLIDKKLWQNEHLFIIFSTVQCFYIFSRLWLARAIIIFPGYKVLTTAVRKSLFYSLPVLINVSIGGLVQNYSKVHFYQMGNKDSMFILAFLMRLGLAIQIIHGLLSAFFNKKIYLNEITFRFFFFKNYLPAMLLVSVCLSVSELGYFRLFSEKTIVSLSTICLVNLYFLLFCIAAATEVIFSVANKNPWLLFVNGGSIAITILLFFSFNLSNSENLDKLIVVMCCQPACFIALLCVLNRHIFRSTKTVVTPDAT